MTQKDTDMVRVKVEPIGRFLREEDVFVGLLRIADIEPFDILRQPLEHFRLFVDGRSKRLFALIRKLATEPD